MQLPGYAVGEPLGPVPHGTSFAATSEPDGAPVEVEVLRVGDPFARVRLLSAADALRRCDGRGLVRVRQVVGPPGHGQGDDVVVVVRDRVDGPDLDTAPRPSPAAAVVLVADVLDALAALHAAGQVHGALDGRAVRLDVSVPARPTPHVTGWGTAALLSGAAGRGADDVRDAALLLDGLLGGEVPPALRDLLGSLLSADPAGRPDAATAATALRALDLEAARPAAHRAVQHPAATVAAAPGPGAPRPAPVDGPGSPPHDEPARADRRWRRLLTVAGAGAVLLPAAALAAVLAAGDGPPDEGRRLPGPYVFAPLARPDGLVVERRWTLERGGAVLRSTTVVRNSTGGPVSGSVDEVVPTSVADEVADLALTPEPDEVLQGDRAVRYDVTALEAYGRTSWEYVVTLPRPVTSLLELAGEADRARLEHEVRVSTQPAAGAPAPA